MATRDAKKLNDFHLLYIEFYDVNKSQLNLFKNSRKAEGKEEK